MAKQKTHSEVGHADAHGGSKFPPFDSTTFSSQLIWLAICFTALYFFLSRIALPRIEKVIEQRRERISRDLDEATRFKEETEKAIADYEQAIAEARAKAYDIAKENQNKLEAEVEKERTLVEEQVTKMLADAEVQIADSKKAALAQVNDVALETTKAIVEKLELDIPQQKYAEVVNSQA